MNNYDKDKVDEMVLALLYLNAHADGPFTRAWKSFDWDAMNRLNKKGFNENPKSKAKSVVFTDEGFQLAEKLFKKHFGGSG